MYRIEHKKDSGNPDEKDEELVNILTDLIGELKTIQEARKASSDRAMISIFKEVNQKWKAIARKIEEPDIMFWEVLKMRMPDLMERIQE